MTHTPEDRPDRDEAPSLVEPDGVNADSDVHGDAPADEARSGGRPERSDQAEEAQAGSGELLGPPRQGPGEPGQELAAGEG